MPVVIESGVKILSKCCFVYLQSSAPDIIELFPSSTFWCEEKKGLHFF